MSPRVCLPLIAGHAVLRHAFLKLDPSNPEHLRIIKSLDPNYSGFVPTSDTDYDVVRKLIKPFETSNPG